MAKFYYYQLIAKEIRPTKDLYVIIFHGIKIAKMMNEFVFFYDEMVLKYHILPDTRILRLIASTLIAANRSSDIFDQYLSKLDAIAITEEQQKAVSVMKFILRNHVNSEIKNRQTIASKSTFSTAEKLLSTFEQLCKYNPDSEKYFYS